jgi:two-component system OmpR family response regulator
MAEWCAMGHPAGLNGKAPKPRLLVVESDAAVSQPIGNYFERRGYEVVVAETVAAMRMRLEAGGVSAIILDTGLPDEDGWSALRWLRTRCDIPVLMLAGKTDPVDKIAGLKLGADDYLDKPCDLGELLARLRSIQRRVDRPLDQRPPVLPDQFRFAGWMLDMVSQQLTVEAGDAVHLTLAEYRLLALLARNPHRVITRDQLMEVVAGRAWEPYDRSVDVHISNLRRKLDPAQKQPSLIRTVRGAGYMFVPQRG